MDKTTAFARLEALQQELNAIETQMLDPDADQALLDDAWELISKEMDLLASFIWDDSEDSRDPQSPAEIGYCGFPCDFGCPTCSASYDPMDEL
jgi:hypothetical protein